MLKPFPEVLEYRGGVRLRWRRFERIYGGEACLYYKVPAVANGDVAIAQTDPPGKLDDILASGFVVAETSTAALQIMDALVVRGYAERLV